MKKLSFIICFLSFLFVYNSFAETPEGIKITKTGKSYLIDFNLPEFTLGTKTVEGTDFTLIETKYGTTTDIGRPALPQISFNLMKIE